MDGIPQEDVYVRYSGVYHPYSHGDLSDTRAPRGYKPFYISHVGRHGSRYPVDRKYVYNGLEPFLKAEAAGILTDEGRKVIAAYWRLDSLSTGEYGILCPLGSAEHKGIATRMATRFPSVFEGRDSVFAISTYKQRCIMSAAYFMSALTAKHPRLRVGLAAGDNNKMYVQHCGSAIQGEWRTHVMDTLVTDILIKADAALAGNDIAADLRFGHDVGLMPFFSLLRIDGFDKAVGFNEAFDVWDSSVMMPMGTNLQMIFYRHPRKDEVLVKLLFNEQETSIPAIGPGPYYRWSELREYLAGLTR